jgi:hypothetical protein
MRRQTRFKNLVMLPVCLVSKIRTQALNLKAVPHTLTHSHTHTHTHTHTLTNTYIEVNVVF